MSKQDGGPAAKPRLRWKREAAETGLRRVGAGPRGYFYYDGTVKYASVSALGGGWYGPVRGWYWVTGWNSSVPHMNTCCTPCATPEEAKKQAAAYVAEHFAAREAK